MPVLGLKDHDLDQTWAPCRVLWVLDIKICQMEAKLYEQT